MINQKLQSCIDACIACGQECDNCATECLRDKDVAAMLRCIELDRTCAEACYATARLLSFDSKYATAFCQACATICEACASECEKHAQHGVAHCERCSAACRRCATECRTIAAIVV